MYVDLNKKDRAIAFDTALFAYGVETAAFISARKRYKSGEISAEAFNDATLRYTAAKRKVRELANV